MITYTDLLERIGRGGTFGTNEPEYDNSEIRHTEYGDYVTYTREGSLVYKILYSEMYSGRYDLEFFIDDGSKDRNHKRPKNSPSHINAVRVFSSVAKSLIVFLKKTSPDVVIFSAENPKLESLYRRFYNNKENKARLKELGYFTSEIEMDVYAIVKVGNDEYYEEDY